MLFVLSIAAAVLSYLLLAHRAKPSHRALLDAQNVEFA